MRNIVALAFVCAASLGACAWGDGSPSDDDDGQTSDDSDGQSRPDAAVQVCGDNQCAPSEIGSCAADCPTAPTEVCGNNTCGGTETPTTCPVDCAAAATCGDGTCDTAGGETEANCPGDCVPTGGVCPSQEECIACLFGLGCGPGVSEEICATCLVMP